MIKESHNMYLHRLECSDPNKIGCAGQEIYSLRPYPELSMGSPQPVTKMSTRNLPGGKGQRARRADNLTAICEPIV
jgi:hypothetical protein